MASSADATQAASGPSALAAAFLSRAEKLSSSGQLRKAEADYAKACDLLRTAAAERAALGSSSALPSLPKALTSLGLLLILRGDTAGAERALVEAVDAALARGSPWPRLWAEPPSQWPMPVLDVALFYLVEHYWQLRESRGAYDKYGLREEQWEAQLAQRGAGDGLALADATPTALAIRLAAATSCDMGDSYAWLFGAVERLMELLGSSGPNAEAASQAFVPLLREQYIHSDPANLDGTGGPDITNLHRAIALVTGTAAGGSLPAAWPTGEPAGSLHGRFTRARQLCALSRGFMTLHDSGARGGSPPQHKSAALQCLAAAARCYAEGGGEWLESEAYAEMLYEAVCVCWDLEAQGVDDAAFPLADGRQVRLRVPNGAGRIALIEEGLRILSKPHGARSPRLIDPLRAGGTTMYRPHGDIVGAIGAFERLVELCVETFGPRHASTLGARDLLGSCRLQFSRILPRVKVQHPSGRGTPIRLSADMPFDVAVAALGGRAGAQDAAVRIFPELFGSKKPGDAAARELEKLTDPADIRRSDDAMAELRSAAAAAQRRDLLCLACGGKLEKVKKCSGCGAADYCSSRCHQVNWPAHKAVCKRVPQPGDDQGNATIGGVQKKKQQQRRGATAETSSAAAERVKKEEAIPPAASSSAAAEEKTQEGAGCAGCGVQQGPTVKLSLCSTCLAVAYCGKACQVAHWKQHKRDSGGNNRQQQQQQ